MAGNAGLFGFFFKILSFDQSMQHSYEMEVNNEATIIFLILEMNKLNLELIHVRLRTRQQATAHEMLYLVVKIHIFS